MIYFIDFLKLSHSAFLSQINVFKVKALDNYSIQGNQHHMPQIDGVPKNEYKEETKLFRLSGWRWLAAKPPRPPFFVVPVTLVSESVKDTPATREGPARTVSFLTLRKDTPWLRATQTFSGGCG